MGHDAIISDHTERLIACKAGQICRRQEFGAAERDDVQQDLWLHLMTKVHYFDPQRGSPHAFVERVVCSGVSVILRQRRRQRRLPWSQAISLEAPAKRSTDDPRRSEKVFPRKTSPPIGHQRLERRGAP